MNQQGTWMTPRYRPKTSEEGATGPRPVPGLGERPTETGDRARNRRGGAFAFLGLGRKASHLRLKDRLFNGSHYALL